MEEEIRALIWGAVAGGVVNLAMDGLKWWLARAKAEVSASMCVRGGREPSHYAFKINIVNTGGTTLHIVKYGILGPRKLKPEHRAKIREIKQMYADVEGWKGRFRRAKLFEHGLSNYEEMLVLAPGQPHFKEEDWVPDWIGIELGAEGLAYAEDSRGRRFYGRFAVPEFSNLVRTRTPEDHESVQRRVPPILRVDKFGNRISPER